MKVLEFPDRMDAFGRPLPDEDSDELVIFDQELYDLWLLAGEGDGSDELLVTELAEN